MTDFKLAVAALMLPLVWLAGRAIRYYRVNPYG